MDTNRRERITAFVDFIKKHRVDQGAVLSIPIIGPALHKIFYGESLDEIIDTITNESQATQAQILHKIESIFSDQTSEPTKISEAILIVGSGNAEEISICEEPITLGTKHRVQKVHQLGGSALNYSMRLLALGYDVYPILTIGNDRIGKFIKNELSKKAANNTASIGTRQFLDSTRFLHSSIKTPSSTVVVQGSERTIFSQPPMNTEGFHQFLQDRIEDMFNCYPLFPSAVMIGHIYPDEALHEEGNFSQSTVLVLDRFKDHSLIYTNFGGSQIKHGIDAWAKYLIKIDIFQLNLTEAKKLFEKEESVNTLKEMILWFQNLNVSVVITLDKLGAVAAHKNKKGTIIVALPIIGRESVRDTTGAGDAFAAGMVAKLNGKKNYSFEDFEIAISHARLCAAECCTHYGASSKCPTPQSLEEFKSQLQKASAASDADLNQLESLQIDRARDILTLIDLAYA